MVVMNTRTNISQTVRRIMCCMVCLGFLMSAKAVLPGVALQNAEGKTVHTDQIAGQGYPVIISFFATWCKPCLRELKAIDEYYEDWQEETGVKMYIVSIDQGQDSKKVVPMVDGYGWEYEVLLDPNGEFKRAMNVQNVPHIFVLNSQGEVVYNHAGYTDGSETDLRQYLK